MTRLVKFDEVSEGDAINEMNDVNVSNVVYASTTGSARLCRLERAA